MASLMLCSVYAATLVTIKQLVMHLNIPIVVGNSNEKAVSNHR
jgi:hypothetical protein